MHLYWWTLHLDINRTVSFMALFIFEIIFLVLQNILDYQWYYECGKIACWIFIPVDIKNLTKSDIELLFGLLFSWKNIKNRGITKPYQRIPIPTLIISWHDNLAREHQDYYYLSQLKHHHEYTTGVNHQRLYLWIAVSLSPEPTTPVYSSHTTYPLFYNRGVSCVWYNSVSKYMQ